MPAVWLAEGSERVSFPSADPPFGGFWFHSEFRREFRVCRAIVFPEIVSCRVPVGIPLGSGNSLMVGDRQDAKVRPIAARSILANVIYLPAVRDGLGTVFSKVGEAM